jgi:hypothetical protein
MSPAATEPPTTIPAHPPESGVPSIEGDAPLPPVTDGPPILTLQARRPSRGGLPVLGSGFENTPAQSGYLSRTRLPFCLDDDSSDASEASLAYRL